VPDVFPSLAYGEMPNVGACDFTVADEVRMPSEDSVYSQINFHLKNYPRLNLVKHGNGSIRYQFKTVSGHTECLENACTDFVDIGKQYFFWLGAYNSDNTRPTKITWLNNGIEECNQSDCRIDIGTGSYNQPASNVQANFGKNTVTVDATTGSTGKGTVTSEPVGINCQTSNSDQCSYTFSTSDTVKLTASPNTDANGYSTSIFTGWSGPDAGKCIAGSETTVCNLPLDGVAKNIVTKFRERNLSDHKFKVSLEKGKPTCNAYS
jgi:hypothetical protein